MRSSNSTSFVRPDYTARDTASVSWGYFVLTIVCACVLAVGFFFAAKQHFNAMDYGMKNSQLRKQVEGLETEKRRLLLAREVSMSPAEIKRSARNLGFRSQGDLAFVTQTIVQTGKTATIASRTAQSAPARQGVSSANSVKVVYDAPGAKRIAADRSVKKVVMQRAAKEDEIKQMVATR